MLTTGYESRFSEWVSLRKKTSTSDLSTALNDINNWWLQLPWCAYRFHWDDLLTWPDPWQLLEETKFCSIATGLGICYTLTLLERPDINDVKLVERSQDNLVLVNKEKYILNWKLNTIVNNHNSAMITNVRHQITQEEIMRKIGI